MEIKYLIESHNRVYIIVVKFSTETKVNWTIIYGGRGNKIKSNSNRVQTLSSTRI